MQPLLQHCVTAVIRLISLLFLWALPAAAADCPDCPDMVELRGGLGRLGDDAGVFTVRIAPFAIARTETTVAQWAACVRAGACAAKQHLRWPQPNMPMTEITFADAQTYAAWLGKITGEVWRLPSEAEWEYAARAGTVTAFPWGTGMEDGYAVCRGCDSRFKRTPAPVGSVPANGWGLSDMNGNVWEWTLDCWHPDHAGRPRDGIARIDAACPKRVVKGGSWYYVPFQSRSAARAGELPAAYGYDIGFRVVRQ